MNLIDSPLFVDCVDSVWRRTRGTRTRNTASLPTSLWLVARYRYHAWFLSSACAFHATGLLLVHSIC